MIHLDTSFLIRASTAGTAEQAVLRRWIRGSEPLGIAAPAWAEFLCGPVSTAAIDAATVLLPEPIPFAASQAVLAARLFNESGRRRGSFIDCMIAATAIEAGAQLATADARDFRRFEALGLQLTGPSVIGS